MNIQKYKHTALRKELHRKLKIQAAKAGQNMNDFLQDLLEEKEEEKVKLR